MTLSTFTYGDLVLETGFLHDFVTCPLANHHHLLYNTQQSCAGVTWNKACPSADKMLLYVEIFQPAAWIITRVTHISNTERACGDALCMATGCTALMGWPLDTMGHWSGSYNNPLPFCLLGSHLVLPMCSLLKVRARALWPMGPWHRLRQDVTWLAKVKVGSQKS